MPDFWNDWNQTWSATTGANQIYYKWINGTSTTGTTTGYTDPWPAWNQMTAYTSTTTPWVVWNQPAAYPQRLSAPAFVRTRTERTEQEWTALREEQDRLRAERDALQAVAREQARKLLYFVLSKAQREQYEREQRFEVVGSHGGQYVIRYGTSGNVHQVVDGREVAGLCAHPNLWVRDREGGWGHLPTEDVLAAQALALMHDESVFQRTANVHWGRAERDHLRLVA